MTLRNRVVQETLIACKDGLSLFRFSEAKNTLFLKREIQFYVIHQIRSSMKYLEVPPGKLCKVTKTKPEKDNLPSNNRGHPKVVHVSQGWKSCVSHFAIHHEDRLARK